MRLELPAGEHHLELVQPSTGTRQKITVDVRPGSKQRIHRRVGDNMEIFGGGADEGQR